MASAIAQTLTRQAAANSIKLGNDTRVVWYGSGHLLSLGLKASV
jgi:hypothetical protein